MTGKTKKTPPDKTQAFIDLADASLRLGYNPGFIAFLCETGKLKGAAKNEEVWQIPEEEIKRFREDNNLPPKTKDQIAIEDLVDVEQAARLLGYGKSYLCLLCRDGAILGAVKSGGCWRIPINEVEKLQQRKSELGTEKNAAKKILQILSPYVMLHFAAVGQKTQELGETLLALKSQLIIDDFDRKTIKRTEDELLGLANYSEKIYSDLKRCGFDEEIKNV